MEDILLSIIIPIKDIDYWKKNIIKNIDLFKKFDFKHEFLFVYSSTKDKSVRDLKKILEKEINTVFCHDAGKGIYSAMNKGIEYSKGSYLIFIGADDTFNQSQISNFIETISTQNNKYDLILFDVLFKGETKRRSFFKKEGGITTQIHWTLGQPRIHQGIIYKKSFIILKKIRYLTSLKVRSDYIFTSELFSQRPLILIRNFPIIFYHKEGFSSKFSYYFLYLEDIKGYFLITRLRRYLLIVIITRILLTLYQFSKKRLTNLKNNLF